MTVNLGLIAIRADRQWCEENAADATPADHLNAIIRAVEAHVGEAAVDQLKVDRANATTLLGKLVRAVTGEWKPNRPHVAQVDAAVRELRAVRDYLSSLHGAEEKGAA